MLFKLAMWMLSLRISWLSKHNKTFRYAIREKKLILQFAISGGKGVRYFDFNQGLFTSRRGWHEKHGLVKSKGNLGERIAVFTFRSGGEAMGLLKNAAKDETVMLAAVRDKKLVVEGDFTLFMWFGWLADQL